MKGSCQQPSNGEGGDSLQPPGHGVVCAPPSSYLGGSQATSKVEVAFEPPREVSGGYHQPPPTCYGVTPRPPTSPKRQPPFFFSFLF
jgi:hypothetical protein